MTALTADRFPTLAVVDRMANADGYALAGHATQPVDGCHACHIARRDHGNRWTPGHGYHAWIEPGTLARKLRILARRCLASVTAQYRAEHAEVMAQCREVTS